MTSDCPQLQRILDAAEMPAGGSVYCTHDWGVIVEYAASNLGTIVYDMRSGAPTPIREYEHGFNLTEFPLSEVFAAAGAPPELSMQMCDAMEAEIIGFPRDHAGC